MTSMFPLTGASEDLWFQQSLYTTTPTTLLSCSRASTGYANTSTGTLTPFGTNTLRITDLGILMENARTNVTIDSQDFSTWADNGADITVDAAVAPDGTTTADKLIPRVSSPNGRYKNLTASGQTTWTIYAKNAGYNFAVLSANATSGSDVYSIVVNLTTGAITKSAVSAGSPTGAITSVETLANGWFRLRITLNQSGSQIVAAASDTGTPTINSNGFPVYAANGTDGNYFWGAQCEVGAFPSSYIVTTGSTATRAQDAITCISTLDTLLNGAAVSVVGDFTSLDGTSNQYFLADGGFTNAFMFTIADTQIRCTFGAGPNNLGTNLGSGLNSTGVKYAVGLSNASPGGSNVANNGTLSTAGSPFTATGITYLLTNQGYGIVRRITVWNSRLSDSTLQLLSNSSSAFYSEPTTLFAQACL